MPGMDQALFNTAMLFEMAGMELTDSLLTLGQFMGVTFFFFAMIAWKTVDLAGDNLPGFGRVFALGSLMWASIIGYHVAIGAAGGATAFGNLGINAVLAILFFVSSNK